MTTRWPSSNRWRVGVYLLRSDPREEFPAPFLIQGRDHWLMGDLLEWIESRRRRDAVPGRNALSSADRSPALGAPDAWSSHAAARSPLRHSLPLPQGSPTRRTHPVLGARAMKGYDAALW